jgi:hypothetical protein
MPIALKVLLQLAVRDIGQLTDIESRRALAARTPGEDLRLAVLQPRVRHPPSGGFGSIHPLAQPHSRYPRHTSPTHLADL